MLLGFAARASLRSFVLFLLVTCPCRDPGRGAFIRTASACRRRLVCDFVFYLYQEFYWKDKVMPGGSEELSPMMTAEEDEGTAASGAEPVFNGPVPRNS